MILTPDPCGFISDPVLCPLEFSTGLPVMRGDEQLLFHKERCGFHSEAAGRVIWIEAFDPTAFTDQQLARIGREGAPGVTDLASIPRLARAIFPPNGRYLKPALKHDQAYETCGYDRLILRAQADGELLADMKAVGCGLFGRQTIYRAVRLGGASGWGR